MDGREGQRPPEDSGVAGRRSDIYSGQTTIGDVGMYVAYAGSVEELEEVARLLEEGARQAGFQTAKCYHVA